MVQPITLRVCHSPWRLISQHVLACLRLLLSGYLISVFGISLKYKLDQKDDHTGWRIPFQFSTVSFVLLTLYHLQATVGSILPPPSAPHHHLPRDPLLILVLDISCGPSCTSTYLMSSTKTLPNAEDTTSGTASSTC